MLLVGLVDSGGKNDHVVAVDNRDPAKATIIDSEEATMMLFTQKGFH